MKHTFEVNKILVPIDFSESSMNTISHALSIAKKAKAEILLLHVVSATSQVFPNLFEETNTTDLLMEKINEEMNRLVDDINSKNEVSASGQIVEGSVSAGVTDVARNRSCDLIVMGAHGISGIQEFFIGSNAFRVVTSATCPVLTVNQTIANSDYKKIALPLDSSTHTKDKVSEVTTMAKLFGAKVYIAGLITEEHEEEKRIFNAKIKQVTDHLSHHDIEFESTTIHGSDITEMTSSFAQTVGADMIAIMTEQEASTGLFVGPHAQRIVNHSRIPVLSVTPIATLDLTSQGNMRPFHS